MIAFLTSPLIVPVTALLAGVAYCGITAWKKIRERELAQEKELRILELEHRERLKAMELQAGKG